MRVSTEDLVRAFQSKGDIFEEFVHHLVRTVGRSCDIAPVNVDWDYRTTVRDGGRDPVVRVGNPRTDKQFLPTRPSVWSIKSGDGGVSPASLKDEILDKKHPKVRKALQDGWAFVWCSVHPANQDKRDDMRRAAREAAEELNVNPAQFEFRWPEHLQGEVNLYPNLIPVYLPHIASTLKDVISLQQWRRDLQLPDEWVGLPTPTTPRPRKSGLTSS